MDSRWGKNWGYLEVHISQTNWRFHWEWIRGSGNELPSVPECWRYRRILFVIVLVLLIVLLVFNIKELAEIMHLHALENERSR